MYVLFCGPIKHSYKLDMPVTVTADCDLYNDLVLGLTTNQTTVIFYHVVDLIPFYNQRIQRVSMVSMVGLQR